MKGAEVRVPCGVRKVHGMPIVSAENHFRRGLGALSEGEPSQAVVHFESAIRLEREHRVTRPQMRYLSYYGVSLAQARRATPDSVRACETAARVDFFNPDLHLNLGRVYLIAGKRSSALATLERARRMAPWHKGIQAELSRLNRRSSPPVVWLDRDHLLNQVLGRLRGRVHAVTSRWLVPRRSALPS